MRTQTWQKEQLACRLRMIVLGLFVVCAYLFLVTFLSLLIPQDTRAATSNTINFQSRLESAGGALVNDGYYNVEFKLYNISAGGTASWTEDYTYNSGSGNCSGPLGGNDCRVRVVNGYLTVNLGSITAFSGINWNQQQWLTMNIGGTGTTGSFPTIGDGEMNPRLLLTATPYAFQAGQLGVTSGSFTSTLSLAAPTTANNTVTIPDPQGAATVCFQNSSACGFALGAGTAFLQGGNSFGAQGVLGTNDANSLAFRTNNTNRLVIDTSATTNFTFQQASTILVASATTGTNLTLQGGAATSGTNVGGNLILQGGAGASTGASGSVIVKSNSNNSTSAFQVQNASAVNLFTVDTTNTAIVLGNDGTSAALTVRGGAATGTNTTGSNITFDASNGTGTGGSGDLIFRTAGPTSGGVIIDATASNKTSTSTNTLSWTHVTANVSNRLLVVSVQVDSVGVTVLNVTYNGSNLTKAGNITSTCNLTANECDAEIWYLVAPSTGSNTVQVTTTGTASDIIGASISLDNVDQTTPVGTATTGRSTTNVTPHSITLSGTTTTQLIVDSIADNNPSISAAGGQTQIANQLGTQILGAASYKTGTASTTTMSWTPGSADTYAQVGLPINPTGNTASDTLTDRLHITAAGNIGIGTANPQTGVEVDKTGTIGSFDYEILLNPPAGFGARFALTSNSNAKAVLMGETSAGNGDFSIKTTSNASWLNGTATWTNRLTVQNSGNVLIGAGSTGESTASLLVLDSQTGSTSDPTGVTGAMYYNASLNEFRCYTEGEWEPCRTQPIDQSYEVEEEWLSGSTSTTDATTGYGNYNWTYRAITTTCSSVSYAGGAGGVAVSSTRPGILKLTTNTTSANIGCRLLLGASTGGTIAVGAGQDIKTSVALGATTANVLRVGMDTNTTGGTGTAGRSTTGVWWEADPSNNSHWEYCYGTGSAATCAATTVSIAANTFVRLEIQIVSATAINFSINGATTSLTGITLGTATAVAPDIACWTETSGTAANCYADYYQLRSDDSSLR